MTREPALRAAGRRTEPGARGRCSCDLLLGLCEAPAVRDVLAGFSVAAADLRRSCGQLHAEVESEPADWRVRIAQRTAGRAADDLHVLLAIVRSADCHAYQLLDRAGVPCGALRRRLIDTLRETENAAAHGPRLSSVRRSMAAAPPAPTPIRSRTSPTALPPEDPPPLTEDTAPLRLRARPDETPIRQSARPDPRRGLRPEPPAPEPSEPEDRPGPAAPAVLLDRPGDAPRLAPILARELAPLHGRAALLARLADAVLRRSPRPPLLVGPHGSGRTLLATHLARLVPQPVFLLSAAAYTDEDSLRADLHTVARNRGVAILDDLDQLGSDVPPACLPALVKIWSSGQPPIVTIVSPEGRARLAAWLPGLAATFDVLTVPALEGDDLRAAIAAAAPAILGQHRVTLAADARLPDLTRLADRFLGGALALPGRALDLLDLACARSVREGRAQVRRDTWIDIVCERSGIPRERIDGPGNQEILDLEGHLARQVVGHEPAIQALSELIRRNRAGFASQRPVATVLLLGPSGVGKTEIAKALCAALFDRPDALVRLNRSEYAESHAVARVICAPPGYVGHEQGGALTDPLLRHPHCVVLLDEIEKAHRDVHQLLLQVFDEGRLTDGRGRTVDFRHAVLLMTSNLGAGCIDEASSDTRLDPVRVLEAARAAFPVELWNRIEAPLVLHPLSQQEMATICQRLARSASERLFRERGIRYRLDDHACRHLVAQCGRDSALGARPLRHVLARQVESRVADAILRGQVRAGMLVNVGVDDGDLVLTAVRA